MGLRCDVMHVLLGHRLTSNHAMVVSLHARDRRKHMLERLVFDAVRAVDWWGDAGLG
jgi:hypothetical protein